MKVNRERKIVSTTVGSVDACYTKVSSVIARLQELEAKYPGCTLEQYTEYYGGNEGSAAIRVTANLPENDKVYESRIKAEEARAERQAALDIEAYERVKAMREERA